MFAVVILFWIVTVIVRVHHNYVARKHDRSHAEHLMMNSNGLNMPSSTLGATGAGASAAAPSLRTTYSGTMEELGAGILYATPTAPMLKKVMKHAVTNIWCALLTTRGN